MGNLDFYSWFCSGSCSPDLCEELKEWSAGVVTACVCGTECGGTPRAPWAQQEMPVMLAGSGWGAVWLGYSLVRVLERALLSRQSFAWNSSMSRHADSLFLRSHLKDVSSPSLLFPRQREQKTKFICIGTERAGVNQPGAAPDLLGGTTGTELSVCPRQRCWGAADAGLL